MNKNYAPRFWLILAFIAIYFVWGTTYLANLYALKGFTPFIISALRYLITGLLLAAFAYLKGSVFPKPQEVKDLAVGGILMLVGGSGLVLVSEQYISSGCAAVIVATEPLWFVLLDRTGWNQYFSNRKIMVGLVMGFIGVALFAHFAPSRTGLALKPGHELAGIAIVFVGCILWVIGTLFVSRRLKSGSFNLWHTTIQLFAAGFFSGFIALINGEWASFKLLAIPMQAWGGLLFLVVFGSLVAYLSFAWLITVQPPAIVSTHTYVNPLIAVTMGWLIMGEQIIGMQIVALVIVLTGVILTQISKEKVVI